MSNTISNKTLIYQLVKLNILLGAMAILAMPSSFLMLIALSHVVNVLILKWAIMSICLLWIAVFIGLILRVSYLKKMLKSSSTEISKNTVSSIPMMIVLFLIKYFFFKKRNI